MSDKRHPSDKYIIAALVLLWAVLLVGGITRIWHNLNPPTWDYHEHVTYYVCTEELADCEEWEKP